MRTPRSIQSNFIVRCEGERVRGWQVRIPDWHPKGPFSKLFSDSHHGGREKAKIVARQYRDKLFSAAALAVPRTKAVHAHHSTNTSGLVGITMSTRHTAGRSAQTSDQDTGYLYWTAYWSTDGRQIKRNFSVAKYGFIDSWEKAVKLRQEKAGHLYSAAELQIGLQYCHSEWERLMEKGIFYP